MTDAISAAALGLPSDTPSPGSFHRGNNPRATSRRQSTPTIPGVDETRLYAQRVTGD